MGLVADLFTDLNYIAEYTLVEISRKDGSAGTPCAMVLRHNDERWFEPLAYTEEDIEESRMLILKQNCPGANFDQYNVVELDTSDYKGWRYHYFGRTKVI